MWKPRSAISWITSARCCHLDSLVKSMFSTFRKKHFSTSEKYKGYIGKHFSAGYRWQLPPSSCLRRRWGRNTTDHVQHLKDIHEVQDIQPHPFIHIRCGLGVSQLKLECAFNVATNEMNWRNGGAGMHPCSSVTPILNEMLTNHQKPNGSPQTMLLKPYSLGNTKIQTMPSILHPHTMIQPTSC